VFTFGKFKEKGRNVRWVLENEPSYILWLVKSNIIEFSAEIVDEANDNDASQPYDGLSIGDSQENWGN